MLGMAFGQWIHRDGRRAIAATLRLGAAAIMGFLVLRLFDGFGNVRPRQTDDAIGFLNTVKYPPAITFLLPAIGIGLVLVYVFSRSRSSVAERVVGLLSVFGRAPLFFYLLHLYLYAQLGAWLGPTSRVAMYGWWLVGLAMLYPACAWFGAFKRRRPTTSIIRFL